MTMSTKLHTPKPIISVKAIKTRKQKLFTGLSNFIGQVLVDVTFHSFIDRLHALLPANILRNTVVNSNKSLVAKTLTVSLLQDTCWRMAGNIESLLYQKAVPVWMSQAQPEWVAASIIRTRLVKIRNQAATCFTFRILSGTPTTLTLTQTWSNKKSHYLAKFRDEQNHGFGFGTSRTNSRGEQTGRLLFVDTRQFFGLQCLLLIDPELSKDSPVASEVGHTGATMGHNQRLLKGRDRLESDCIKKLPGNPECFCCPIGVDKCIYGTHPQTYTVAVCSLCGQKGFVDSADIEYKGLCIQCARKERLSK